MIEDSAHDVWEIAPLSGRGHGAAQDTGLSSAKASQRSGSSTTQRLSKVRRLCSASFNEVVSTPCAFLRLSIARQSVFQWCSSLCSISRKNSAHF